LTKALEPLESAGILKRTGGGYAVVDSDALGSLLVAAAALNIAAKQTLLSKAREEIPAAERLAREIREEEEA
jgi:DeoR/GlpR family transcriptional regulator of sugar metabolism